MKNRLRFFYEHELCPDMANPAKQEAGKGLLS
jgi:hypothetical protein